MTGNPEHESTTACWATPRRPQDGELHRLDLWPPSPDQPPPGTAVARDHHRARSRTTSGWSRSDDGRSPRSRVEPGQQAHRNDARIRSKPNSPRHHLRPVYSEKPMWIRWPRNRQHREPVRGVAAVALLEEVCTEATLPDEKRREKNIARAISVKPAILFFAVRQPVSYPPGPGSPVEWSRFRPNSAPRTPATTATARQEVVAPREPPRRSPPAPTPHADEVDEVNREVEAPMNMDPPNRAS